MTKERNLESTNAEIRVAIQGQSLTAFDAVKTIFENSSEEFKGYDIKVDMLSRSGVMQQVKGSNAWADGIFPSGTEIKQSIIEEIADKQDNKTACGKLC